MVNNEYWDEFYRGWQLAVPSQFCALVSAHLEAGDLVVDFGCGNGRDAIWFGNFGYPVLAIDASEQAIVHARGQTPPRAKVEYHVADIGEIERISELIRGWRRAGRMVCYARFFLHAISAAQEASFFRILAEVLEKGDRCFFEFRTLADASGEKVFGDHYRRYIDIESLVSRAASFGFVSTYLVEGVGMAYFRGEDAVVGRLFLER
ncbi:class I SAM-dependent methyltransferase [Micromonospora sp. STR1s_5]|nr:class I SAM-dependent methyltransferase [Micromonospora sp. STR1s_5]